MEGSHLTLQAPVRIVSGAFLSRRALASLSVGAFLVGVMSGLAPSLGAVSLAGTVYLAAALAVSLALAKTGTACGVNVLGYLSRAQSPLLTRACDATAYAVASAATATLIGLALSAAGTALGADRVVAATVPILAYLGAKELGITPTRHVASRSWQVPQDWVKDRRVGPLIWGVCLGSGFATWMPFPSYFGLITLAFLLPFPNGGALLGLYGAARAAPAVVTSITGGRYIHAINDRMWPIVLYGHITAGCLSFALAGALASFAVR